LLFYVQESYNESWANCTISTAGLLNVTVITADWFGLTNCTLNASDGSLSALQVVWINVTNVNDAPVMDIGNYTTPEDISFHINLSDNTTDVDNSTNQLTWYVQEENESQVDCNVSPKGYWDLFGGSHYFRIDNPWPVDVPNGSISVWTYQELDRAIDDVIFDRRGSNPNGVRITQSPSLGDNDGWCFITSGITQILCTQKLPVLNTLYNVVVTWNGTAGGVKTKRIYIDGVEKAKTSDTFNISSIIDQGGFGYISNGGAGILEWDGRFNKIAFYNKTLSLAEIESENASGQYGDLPVTTGLTNYWPADGNFEDIQGGLDATFLQGVIAVINFTELDIMPYQDWNGLANCTINVTDGALWDASTFWINVTPVNDAPVWTAFNLTTPEDTNISERDISGNVSDVDNATLLFYVQATHNESQANCTISTAGLLNVTVITTDWYGLTNCTLNASDGSLSALQVVWINVTPVNDPPNAPTLLEPTDGNTTITNRTVFFNWTVTDIDGDTDFTYDLIIQRMSCELPSNPDYCSIDEVNITGIPDSNYTTSQFLDVSAVYNWSVRAKDDTDYGSWAAVFNFTLQPVLTLTFTTDTVSFGEMWGGGNSDNTTDDSPPPFVIENQGNVRVDIINITVNESLFDSVAHPNDYFKYKVDNVTGEEGAFNWSSSVTTWTQVNNHTNFTAIKQLDWNDSKDSAEIDLYVLVPPTESVGTKITTFTIYVNQT